MWVGLKMKDINLANSKQNVIDHLILGVLMAARMDNKLLIYNLVIFQQRLIIIIWECPEKHLGAPLLGCHNSCLANTEVK